VNWREDEALVHVGEGSVEVLAFVYWPLEIVLAIHNLKIILKPMFNLFNDVALGRIWVNWLSSLPVISKFEVGDG